MATYSNLLSPNTATNFLCNSSSSSLPFPRPSITASSLRNPTIRFLPSSRLSIRQITTTTTTRVLTQEGSQIQLDTTGGGGGGEDKGGNGSGGGGGGGGSDGDEENKEEFGDNNNKKMATGMSMSQKLTLGYAALVGVGGVMGYVKSGSQKSLAAGGISALLLYYVYTQLPVNPMLASSLGFVLSGALLGVMGSRFKSSGKVFPAGVVSIVSFIMTGGYLHGIMRGLH